MRPNNNNNNNNWTAFGREFTSCLNDIEEDFKKLPRWQRMFFHRQIRKAAREEKARENQAMRLASAQKRKKNNNKRSSPSKKPPPTRTMSMWAPRK